MSYHQYTAGRYKAEVHTGVVELHRNGSRQEVASLRVGSDDLLYVLGCAAAAHPRGAVIKARV
jgi:hypothetical protein